MSEVLAGKIGVTNGGEWNAETYYEEATFVRHQNNLYLSNLPSTGVEPTNEEYWMLAMEGFSGKDVQTLIDSINNIIDGTTQVGNAKTLEGHGAGYFAPLADLANYLPLTGGTIGSNEYTPLTIKNTNYNHSIIGFNGLGGALGWLGFQATNTPAFRNTDGAYNALFHTGNKPSGTYTGNGSDAERTVNIGGVGGVLAIFSAYDSGVVIATPYGAICKVTSSVLQLELSEVKFVDGVLTIKSKHQALNTDGQTYRYQVL